MDSVAGSRVWDIVNEVGGRRVPGYSTYGMQSRPQLRVFADGRAHIPQTHGELVVWAEDPRSVTLKEQGHSEGYNQYNPAFKVPTQFHTFLKLDDDTVVEVATVPLRAQKEKVG